MASFKQLSSGKTKVEVRVKGHPRTAKTFRTRGQAKTWASKTEDSMRSGTYKQTEQMLPKSKHRNHLG